MKRQSLCLSVPVLLFLLLIFPCSLLAAPHYEGKIMTIIVGSAAGGGYDSVARLLAKHLPKYIPGKPSIIVQNMPGASSMLAANHVYNRAKPDGLTLLTTYPSLAFMQLLKVEGVKFDLTKFSFIGSAASETNVFVIRNDLPYRTFQDVLKSGKPVYLGGLGAGTITTQMSNISRDFLGLDAKIVEYRGTAELILATERKEIDGFWLAYQPCRPYIERGLLRPLVRGVVSRKGLENLPVNEDLSADPTGKAILTMLNRMSVMARLFIAPPKTPAPLMDTLKESFDKAIKSPELQADAAKGQMELEYVKGEECLRLLTPMFKQPPAVVDAVGKYVKF